MQRSIGTNLWLIFDHRLYVMLNTESTTSSASIQRKHNSESSVWMQLPLLWICVNYPSNIWGIYKIAVCCHDACATWLYVTSLLTLVLTWAQRPVFDLIMWTRTRYLGTYLLVIYCKIFVVFLCEKMQISMVKPRTPNDGHGNRKCMVVKDHCRHKTAPSRSRS